MNNLPPYIIMVGFRQSNSYKTIVRTLKSYIEGMLYISYVGWDKKTTYYILPHNAVVLRILRRLHSYMAFDTNIEIMEYGTYMYENNNLPLDNYSIVTRVRYAKMLPPIIKINADDKEKLKLFI